MLDGALQGRGRGKHLADGHTVLRHEQASAQSLDKQCTHSTACVNSSRSCLHTRQQDPQHTKAIEHGGTAVILWQ